MKQTAFLSILMVLFSLGCIKDDFIDDEVDPIVQITSTIDTLGINETFQFEAVYLNNVGFQENVPILWSSSAPDVISINSDGLAMGISEGNSVITAEYESSNGILTDQLQVSVGAETVIMPTERSGTIRTTSSYTLTGDFTLSEDGSGIKLSFDNNYEASTALPGLYLYLSNNQNSIANALEVGEVETFSGSHIYNISNTGINDYNYLVYFCKPFNVKVGDGEIE